MTTTDATHPADLSAGHPPGATADHHEHKHHVCSIQTFVAILLSGAAALQAVQILAVYLLQDGYALDAEFGKRLAAVVALVILAAVFCIIFWLLKVIRTARQT